MTVPRPVVDRATLNTELSAAPLAPEGRSPPNTSSCPHMVASSTVPNTFSSCFGLCSHRTAVSIPRRKVDEKTRAKVGINELLRSAR